jgi:hypothetical protein
MSALSTSEAGQRRANDPAPVDLGRSAGRAAVPAPGRRRRSVMARRGAHQRGGPFPDRQTEALQFQERAHPLSAGRGDPLLSEHPRAVVVGILAGAVLQVLLAERESMLREPDGGKCLR